MPRSPRKASISAVAVSRPSRRREQRPLEFQREGCDAWLEDPLRVVRRPDRRHRVASHARRQRSQALEQGRGGARDGRGARGVAGGLGGGVSGGGGEGGREGGGAGGGVWDGVVGLGAGAQELRKGGKPVV